MTRSRLIPTLGVILWSWCFIFSSRAQDTAIQTTPSNSRAQSSLNERAHTNFDFLLRGKPPKLAIEDALKDVKVEHLGASMLQVIRPHSDLSRHGTGEKYARLALASGNPVPAGATIRAHTDYVYLADPGAPGGIPIDSIKNNVPDEIRERYGVPQSGSGGLVVIVDAYKYPTAEEDLKIFSTRFNLPECSRSNGCLTLHPVSANILPDTDLSIPDCGWSQEAAIDIQWAHAISPLAKIVLVEAVSSDKKDMLYAVEQANNIAAAEGGGVMSLSWSYDEFHSEASDDHYFAAKNVLYFAASGDNGGVVEYPAASPNVISVGGTEVLRDQNNVIRLEQGWSDAGGGNSNFEQRPLFQTGVENITDLGRVVPDIAGPAGLDVSLQNGSPIYAGTVCPPYQAHWYAVGGTSLATPILAAYATYAYPHGGDAKAALNAIYKNRTNSTNVRDIVSGQAGSNACRVGYDRCSGVGVPASSHFIMSQ